MPTPTRFRVEVLTVAGWHVRRDLDHAQAATAITRALFHPTTQQVRLDVDVPRSRPTEFPDEPCTS